MALTASAIGIYKLMNIIERLSVSKSERSLVRSRMTMIRDLALRGCEVEADLSMTTAGGDEASSEGTGIRASSEIDVRSGGKLVIRGCQQQMSGIPPMPGRGEPGYMGRYPEGFGDMDPDIMSEGDLKIVEGLWDLIRGKTQPRERVTFGDGMSHADMSGYQSTSLEDSEFALAAALVDWIESNTGWSGPGTEGALADFDRDGWLKIADSDGAGPWAAIIGSVSPFISDQASDVLSEWRRLNYIVMSEPDIFSGGRRPMRGIWLRWYGFKELRRARDESRQSASMQYSF
jgi:hypothetical protein